MKKNNLRSAWAAFLAVAVLVWCTGCNGVLTRPVVTAIPGPVPVPRVNVAPPTAPDILTRTNTAPAPTDPVAVPLPSLPVAAPPSVMYRTNYEVNPTLAAAIETLRQLNTTLNPTPTAPLADGALKGAAVLLGLFAAWQTKRANKAGATRDAVIHGVETFADSTAGLTLTTMVNGATTDETHGDVLKRTIARVSEVVGVKRDLSERVQMLTGA